MRKVFSEGRGVVIAIANYSRVSKLPETVLKDARDVADLLRSDDYAGTRETT